MSIVGVTASSRRQVPNAPTIGTATDVGTSRAFNNGAAVVTFTPSAVGFEATSYTVTSSPGGFTATGASSPLTVTGLQSNTAYTFTATATNFVGTGSASAASNSITATTVPQAPTIGTPTLADGQAYTGSANIGVVFTANATGGKAITTFTATSSSTTAVSGATSPITISDTVGTARTYTVTASNSNGTSLASSASASITPSSVPQAPTVNSVTNVAGRPANSPQASVAFTANATGGSAITGYTVTSSSGATNTGATSPILITESAAGTYTYTVKATNARGTSLASTGLAGGVSSVPTAPTIGTLSNVTGIAYGSNPQFTLTFTAPTSTGGSAVTSYKYSTNGGTNYVTAPGTTSPMTLTTQSASGTPAFVAGTSYTVILIAVNTNGDSPASAASNSRVAATIPSTPTFTLSSTGATNITGTYSYSTGGQAVTSYSSNITPTISPTIGGTTPVGNTSGALTYTASYVQGNTYTVPFSITNPMGTATAISQTITPFAATAPGAPATLSAAVASTTSVTLTYGAIAVNGSALTAWQGSGTSTGDIVSTPAINLTYSGTPSAAGSTVTVTGTFAATQSYTFTMKVRNGVGLSAGVTSNGVIPLPAIIDNFNRTTTSNLGTTSSGVAWNTIRGTWFANGSQGQSNDGAGNYPLSAIPLGQNTTIKLDTSGGCGIAFWVTDANSWWGAFPHYSSSSTSTCTGGTVYCFSAGCTPPDSCGTISQTTTQSCTGPTVSCYSAGCIPNGNCGSVTETITYSCSSYDPPENPGQYYLSTDGSGNQICVNSFNIFGGSQPAVASYVRSGPSAVITGYTRSSPSTVTTTTFTSGFRFVHSSGGTVTTQATPTLATSTSGFSTIASMQVETSGLNLAIKSYSAAGQTTQLGTTFTTQAAEGVARGTSVGIVKAPTTANQGVSVDNFNATG